LGDAPDILQRQAVDCFLDFFQLVDVRSLPKAQAQAFRHRPAFRRRTLAIVPIPEQVRATRAAVRYAAFNVADNMATLIRNDTALSPMLFVIGLGYSGGATEPLDADWLARVANDPNYVTVGSDPIVPAGRSVYQNSQTPGMYSNSTKGNLGRLLCASHVSAFASYPVSWIRQIAEPR
jgi:hypothetical protein